MSFTRNVSVANASVANASVADDFEFNEDIDWEEVWANEEPVTDDEGMTWPERRTFTVSHIVQSPDGKVWRVAGFTLANTVIVRPHGLGHEAGIVTVEYAPAALVHPAQADIPVMHREGLVLLVGGAL